MLAITPDTRIAELLDAYPQLEDVLVAQAPAFARLRNPVLRRTVARVATLRQAAGVGGLEVRALVAALRAAAGQDAGELADDASAAADAVPPAWLDENRVAVVVDADALLDAGEVPLARVNAAAAALDRDRLLRVDAGFRPVPLVDALARQGYPTFLREGPAGRFSLYVASRR